MVEKPLIAITLGDPCGVGPEVVAKALANDGVRQVCRPLVVGSGWVLKHAMKILDLPLTVRTVSSHKEIHPLTGTVDVLDTHSLSPQAITVGRISAEAGSASVEWVRVAGRLAQDRLVHAIATAPINKQAVSLAGYRDIGHMELLQSLSGSRAVATMLVSGTLRVVHLTTHRSLRYACTAVTRDNVLDKVHLTHAFFRSHGFAAPRIGVAALNPHASDGGLLGDEEKREIAPAVALACAHGIDVTGPVPADIIFTQAIQGKYDVILALYHDQGHVAIKVHGWEMSVSVTIGLPFIRTSVDHGTAFDIAGNGTANAESMTEAIKMAASLASGQGLPG